MRGWSALLLTCTLLAGCDDEADAPPALPAPILRTNGGSAQSTAAGARWTPGEAETDAATATAVAAVEAAEGAPEDPLELRVLATPWGIGRVRLDVTLTNTGPRPLYVFTPLSSYRSGGWAPSERRFYLQRRGAGTVELSKRLWPRPRAVKIPEPEVPFLTRIDPGASQQEQIPLRSPLAIDFPYLSLGAAARLGEVGGPQTSPASLQTEARELTVTYGYIEGGAVEEEPERAFGIYHRIPYEQGIAAQRLVSRQVRARVRVGG